MKTIGIIIGTDDEPITKKYFLKNKKKFECLNKLLETLDYIPFDYALYAVSTQITLIEPTLFVVLGSTRYKLSL